MELAAAAFVLPPALAIGSFLNRAAARLPEGRSLVHPPSTCGSCGTRLARRDNIPLVSYLLLRGRCRTCREPIGVRYLAVELVTALLLVACFVAFGFTADAFVAAFFVSALVVLSAIDFERHILPNRIVLPATVVVLAVQLALHSDRAVEWIVSALGASLFLFVALLAYPKGMGMGDVKLALLLGAMLGYSVGFGLLVGMLAALVPSVALLARNGLAARKMAIPFGPFLAFGAVVALFWGDAALEMYLRGL